MMVCLPRTLNLLKISSFVSDLVFILGSVFIFTFVLISRFNFSSHESDNLMNLVPSQVYSYFRHRCLFIFISSFSDCHCKSCSGCYSHSCSVSHCSDSRLYFWFCFCFHFVLILISVLIFVLNHACSHYCPVLTTCIFC